jgi:hypothetical protein
MSVRKRSVVHKSFPSLVYDTGRHAIVSWIRRRPWVYVPLRCALAKDSEGASRALNSRTQILIDAYPRSANSFATVAFQMCQERPTAVAHHFHAAATVIFAALRSIPTLTIIRDPDDACISNALLEQASHLTRTFSDYVNFYEPIRPYREKMVVARFETVVTDLGQVIDVVNRRFGTSFTRFQHTPENVRRVKEFLAERTVRQFGSDGFEKGHGETPTVAKQQLKADLAPLLNDSILLPLRTRAKELFSYYHTTADV